LSTGSFHLLTFLATEFTLMQKNNYMISAESIRFHQEHPEISIDRYVKTRMLELWDSICSAKKVYLDKRFWILLRDANMGRSTDSAAEQLLYEVKAAVERGTILCPISESIFLELLKQQDLQTRRATAELIDDLSHGVTLVPFEQRVAQELINVSLKSVNDVSEYHEPNDLVWSKLSYVLGVVHPSSTPLGPTDELALQKAFFDHMWQFSLAEMLEFLDAGEDFRSNPFVSTAERLTKLNREHQSEVKQFKQVYIDEFRGALSLFMDIPRRWSEDEFARKTGKLYIPTDEEKQAHEQHLHTVFGNSITKKSSALMLPSLHISSLCYAAVRWDKGRKMAPNDIYDFHHAAAAVGYCNAFMTEHPLKTLLQQRHLGLTEDFPCSVMADVEEAISWVRERAS
jgi:hypothetical protein